jgi:nucleotide-binding universal stress UspA family protein
VYKSILVPLDGSKLAEAILPEIEKIAFELKSRIILVRVSQAYVFPGVDPSDAQIRAIRQSEEYLRGLERQLTSRGFEVEVHTPYGDSAEKILETCSRYDFDLIAMSTHGRSGLGRWLLGSVAEKVVRHSEKPVLLLRAQKSIEDHSDDD